MIRAVVIDDSPTSRRFLCAALAAEPDFEIAGEASDGENAVALVVRERPDVVVMDVHMPGFDGFEATRRIMRERPTPIVIVTASLDLRDARHCLDAVAAGAVHLLEKPSYSRETNGDSAGRFVRTVRAMASVSFSGGRRPARTQPGRTPSTRRVDCVAVAASTGGPGALRALLSGLDGGFRAPIVVVQHMSEGFLASFVSWLGEGVAIPVGFAAAGAFPERGAVAVAPELRHTCIDASGRFTARPAAGEPHVPGADPLFSSAAAHFGERLVAVVLTGMGEDGLAGAREVRRRGGLVLCQDEASSVVYGMPSAVAAEGLADASLSPAQIGEFIRRCSDAEAR